MADTYYKLATWDARSFCFRDGKRAYGSEAEARADAKAAGRYRVSEVTDAGRRDLEPFDVTGAAAAAAKPQRLAALTDRPLPRRGY